MLSQERLIGISRQDDMPSLKMPRTNEIEETKNYSTTPGNSSKPDLKFV